VALPASGGQVAAGLAAYQGRKIIVGIRPEDLSLPESSASFASAASAGSPALSASFAPAGSPAVARLVADARVVEVLGSEQHVYFSVDATPVGGEGESAQDGLLAASAPNGVARLDPRAAVRAGTRVTFAVDAARLHFFDSDTGNAIG